ncbi:MAG: asparagine synthase (glutamine-hydrolyzing) [Terriglobales bacterium]
MCGIAGIYGENGAAPVRAEEISRMCAAIAHRGPDDQGAYIDGTVGIGMTRLSIIDLVSGKQPIHNEDQSIWVVFNGEIYNFSELREELIRAGHRFYTHTDSEVIPHLYEELGLDFVKKLRGMFAIALYDRHKRCLLLARDRLGKKPLAYARTGDRIFFASEIRAILAVAPELAAVDREALLGFFQFGYIADPGTAFFGIKRLPPGHILRFQDGRLEISRYWEVPPLSGDDTKPEAEWLELLESELEKAVRMRLMSDVPLGALLSGGVDSSTVVALMARASSAPIKTFSVINRSQDFNEGGFARTVAEHFGTEHHELLMEPELFPILNELTALLEEPFGDSSMLPTYGISRLVREHVTVALSGDGGDELFAGYDRYGINVRRERFHLAPEFLGRLYRTIIFPRLPQRTRGRRFLYNSTLPFRDRYLDSISFLPVEDDGHSVFSAEFLHWAATAQSPRAAFAACYDAASADCPLSRLQWLDIKTYRACDILPKVDRMSMAASLEMRAPILDHVFLELAAKVPSSLKLRNGQGKYILKKLAERVGVPREVIYRPKQGFAIPLVHWFKANLKDEIRDILLDRRTIQRGYFDSKNVAALLEEHGDGVRDRSAEIWLLLVFELWHRNFLEPLALGAFPIPRFPVRGTKSIAALTVRETGNEEHETVS